MELRLVGLFALATFVALAIQTIAPLWLPVRGFTPHLVLILAVDLGFRHASALGAMLAFAMGYATDAVAGSTLGLNAFTVTLVFLMAYEISRHLLATSGTVGALTVLLGIIINAAVALVMTSGFAVVSNAQAIFSPRTLTQAAVSAMLTPPVFALMNAAKLGIGIASPKRTRVD